MAESYEINLEIQGGEQPALVMETEGGATDGASARNAEAWANGTRNGVPVTEGDPAYHNNSKYYRDSAAAIVAGDIIDDDAGIGDYDLTWSADKLTDEFGSCNDAIATNTADIAKDREAALPTGTAEGDMAAFNDGAGDIPMRKCILTIPYSSTALTKVYLNHTGKDMTGFGSVKNASNENIGSDGKIVSNNYNNLYAYAIPPALMYVRKREWTSYYAFGQTDTLAVGTQLSARVSKSDSQNTFQIDNRTNKYPYLIINRSANTISLALDDYEQIKETGKSGHRYEIDLSGVSDFYGGTIDIINGVVVTLYDENGDELATPVETEITPIALKSYYGKNILWSDSGSVSVVYFVDAGIHDADRVAEEQADVASIHAMIADSDAVTATESHAIGDVFICNDQLLRATSVIASGETISTGSGGNAETINLADYIAEKATAIAGVQSNVDLLEEKAIALGLTPMNRVIFPNYRKNAQTGSGANLRYVDVLFNTIRSEGHTLTGSTYRGVLMTSTNGARLPGANIGSDFTMYKSDFKPINTPTLQSGTAKLVVHIAQSGDNAGSGNNSPITQFYTYDVNGHVKKVLVGAPAMAGSYDLDWYFILPSEFTTNKNICVGVNFQSPKHTIDRKIEFMFILESLLPESMTTLTITDTGMTVQDDPT